MGLRLHKAIGYAKPLTIEEHDIYTSKVNALTDKFDDEDRTPVKEYVSFLKTKYDGKDSSSIDYIYARSLNKLPENFKSLNMGDMFSFIHPTVNDDAFASMFFVTLPFQHYDWFRVDNGIDFVTHFERFDEPQNIVTLLDKALYPFNYSLMHRETGEHIPASPRHKILVSLHQNGDIENKEVLDSISLDEYKLPFDEVVKKYTVASVPVEVQDLMEWVGLTSSSHPVNQTFCPAVAEWWD